MAGGAERMGVVALTRLADHEWDTALQDRASRFGSLIAPLPAVPWKRLSSPTSMRRRARITRMGRASCSRWSRCAVASRGCRSRSGCRSASRERRSRCRARRSRSTWRAWSRHSMTVARSSSTAAPVGRRPSTARSATTKTHTVDLSGGFDAVWTGSLTAKTATWCARRSVPAWPSRVRRRRSRGRLRGPARAQRTVLGTCRAAVAHRSVRGGDGERTCRAVAGARGGTGRRRGAAPARLTRPALLGRSRWTASTARQRRATPPWQRRSSWRASAESGT